VSRADIVELFLEMEEMLIEKLRQRTFLYDTKSPDYRDQHMRANAWEEIGKELGSHDVRIVCPRLNRSRCADICSINEGPQTTCVS
jgi:hypothetical protein